MRVLLLVTLLAGTAMAQDLILDDGSALQVDPSYFSEYHEEDYSIDLKPYLIMRYPIKCHDGTELAALEADEICSLTLSRRLADNLAKELERHGYEIKKKEKSE